MVPARTENMESTNLKIFMTQRRKTEFVVTEDLLMRTVEEKRKKDEEWWREEAERVGMNE